MYSMLPVSIASRVSPRQDESSSSTRAGCLGPRSGAGPKDGCAGVVRATAGGGGDVRLPQSIGGEGMYGLPGMVSAEHGKVLGVR
jgi:hypothetical protein